MARWLRRARGALVFGVLWAVAWGVIGGGLMEAVFDPRGRIADIWPAVLGIPGFFCGVLFSIVLATAEHRRQFHDLSLPRFGMWGALAGAALGTLGVGILGMSAAALIPPTLLGAISAPASLALARRGADRERLSAGDAD